VGCYHFGGFAICSRWWSLPNAGCCQFHIKGPPDGHIPGRFHHTFLRKTIQPQLIGLTEQGKRQWLSGKGHSEPHCSLICMFVVEVGKFIETYVVWGEAHNVFAERPNSSRSFVSADELSTLIITRRLSVHRKSFVTSFEFQALSSAIVGYVKLTMEGMWGRIRLWLPAMRSTWRHP
jgi:hypothetical protein